MFEKISKAVYNLGYNFSKDVVAGTAYAIGFLPGTKTLSSVQKAYTGGTVMALLGSYTLAASFLGVLLTPVAGYLLVAAGGIATLPMTAVGAGLVVCYLALATVAKGAFDAGYAASVFKPLFTRMQKVAGASTATVGAEDAAPSPAALRNIKAKNDFTISTAVHPHATPQPVTIPTSSHGPKNER